MPIHVQLEQRKTVLVALMKMNATLEKLVSSVAKSFSEINRIVLSVLPLTTS